MKEFEECESAEEFFVQFHYTAGPLEETCSFVKAKAKEATTIRNPFAFSSSSSSFSSSQSRPAPVQRNEQVGVISKRSKPNTRILLNGEERVVTPYIPLPPNSIVLDPKRKAENKDHIHPHSSDNKNKRKEEREITSNEMVVEKKPNIRILVNGEERVVTPYFPLPPNAIVLDPKQRSSKQKAEDKDHIHSHSYDGKNKRDEEKKKITSNEMVVEKKPNIRILVNGEERVVTPFFPLPPNAIVLDPKQRSSKQKAEDKHHIHSHSYDGKNKRDDERKKITSNEMVVEKKPNIRILVNGEERVVTPYFPLPPNAIVLDPRQRSSKRKVEDKDHIYAHSSGNMNQRKKEKKKEAASNEMDVEKNLEDDNLNKNKKSITLSAAEKELDIYKRVSHGDTWVAPRSPYHLLQEDHCFDPWRVLIICMLLNRTKGSEVKARGVLPKLFKICPTAEAAENAQEEDLRELLRPLGLHNKKAKAIKKLSSEYLGSEWTHVTQLPGVGKYAADAYAIFCVGKPEEVTPLDHKLVDYWKFVCEKRAQGQRY